MTADETTIIRTNDDQPRRKNKMFMKFHQSGSDLESRIHFNRLTEKCSLASDSDREILCFRLPQLGNVWPFQQILNGRSRWREVGQEPVQRYSDLYSLERRIRKSL
jgi:hypothetical protein